jgi:hypothetical protein
MDINQKETVQEKQSEDSGSVLNQFVELACSYFDRVDILENKVSILESKLNINTMSS